jgi:WD40 repeat protein
VIVGCGRTPLDANSADPRPLGSSGEARLWDVRTGLQRGASMRQDGAVYAVAFSPDGTTVMTGSSDGTARLWDAATGRPMAAPMRHDSMITDAAFSPDGTTLLTGSADKTARLWNAHTGTPIADPIQHGGGVNCVAFNPDGTAVMTGSSLFDGSGEAYLCDIRSGWPIAGPLRPAPPPQPVLPPTVDRGSPVVFRFVGYAVESSMPSPKWKLGANLIAESDQGAPLVAPTVTYYAPRPELHEMYLAAYSPDGRTIITAGPDFAARLWDADTGKVVGVPMKHDGEVNTVAYCPNGNRVVTGSGTVLSKVGEARLWDGLTGAAVGEPMKHAGPVTTVAFSPDGNRLLTGSDDKTGRIWDVQSQKAIGVPLQHADAVIGSAWSPDGSVVITASADNTARLWNARSGAPIGNAMEHRGALTAVAFSPDGRTVVTGSADKTARLWNTSNGKVVGARMIHSDRVTAVAFSPNGTSVLTGSSDNTARMWDGRTGRPLGEPMQHNSAVHAVAYSRDGATVLTGSGDGRARFWDVRTCKPIGLPMPPIRIRPASALSGSETSLTTAISNAAAHDYRWAVDSVAWSPNGSTIVTVDEEKTGRIWSTPIAVPDGVIEAVALLHTNMRLGDSGRLEALTPADYANAWKVLETKGSTYFDDQRRRDEARSVGWHRYNAAEAELRGDWFAAEFNLRWMLRREPNDVELRHRYEDTKKALAAAGQPNQPTTKEPTTY